MKDNSHFKPTRRDVLPSASEAPIRFRLYEIGMKIYEDIMEIWEKSWSEKAWEVREHPLKDEDI
jgi:hypothetical protein